MLFVAVLTIPANTTAASPARATLTLAPGRVTEVSIFFPYKRGDFVGVRLIHHDHQLFPTNLDGWIVGDEETVDWGEECDSLEEPYELYLEGYNTDDTFPHKVYCRIVMLEMERVRAIETGGLLGRVAEFLGIRG